MTKALFHLRQFRLLLIVLLCALFSIPLSAREAYVELSLDQETLTYHYDNNRGYRHGATWVIGEGSSWYYSSWWIRKVVFKHSFEDYRPTSTARWFANFENLNTIVGLENLNTSAVTDMEGMFSGCSSLKELNVSNFNTSAVTDMSEMFRGCSSLEELNVSNFNTSAVTDMEGMFSGCSSLKELNVSNFNTSAVTNMKGMFGGCSGLKELNVSNFNTSKVTDMHQMFEGCSGLKELNVSNFNTSKVTDMRYMFYYCSGLKELNVSNFNNSKVISMENMFERCSSLKSLNLSNFNTSAVRSMREMFAGCSSLKELNVSNFNTSAVMDMSNIFASCSGLTELNVSNFNTSAVTDMNGMFYNCSSLTELNVSNFNTSKVTDMGGMFKNCSGLKTIFNTNAWRCEKSLGMFSGCTQLKGAVKYDGSRNNIEMANPEAGYFFDPNKKIAYVQQSEDQQTLTFYYDVNRAFRSGKTWGINEKSRSSRPVWTVVESPKNRLQPAVDLTVESPNKAVTKVVFDASFNDFKPTTTAYWFYDLSALTTIEGLENLNTSEVTDMSQMFYGCSSLRSLNLSNFNTSEVTNMSWMFASCSSLTSLNVSSFNTSKVEGSGLGWIYTGMTGMFYGCSVLTSLNLSNFNTSAVTNMGRMFYGCSGLKELNVSNFNTSAVADMLHMFSGCSGLKTIFNTQTWLCKESEDMFKGCTQLEGAVKYDASKLDVTMANPTTGYFTDPTPKAYVLQSEDQHTLTFYYDNNRKLRSGKTWDIDEKSSSSKPAWAGTVESPNNVVTKVVFNASFKDFRPTTTKGWFYKLSALTTIEGLENLNTSAVTNMSLMFYGCSGLKELNVSNFNTSAVMDMGGMFYGCSGLKELNVSNFNTSSVTNMGHMFYGCSGLKELNVFNFNTSKVTDMGDMFFGCSDLTSLNVSSFNTSKVTDMGWMFSGCSGLKELNVSNFNTSKVTAMSDMFYGCSGLKELNVSNFNTSAVTNMNQMFTDCSGLKTILNPNTWRSDNSINMFYGCTQLKGAVKYDASKLDVTMANPTTGYFTDPNREYPKAYVLQSEDQHTLTFYYDNNRKLRSGKTWDIDEKSSSSKPVWAGTDESPNKAVTKVVFDASFKDFRPTTTSSWFSYFKALTTIVGLENFNTSAVTDMGWMFYGCSGLKELNVSNLNTSAVTDMGWMFYGCSGLKELNVSNFNTSAVTNMSLMFYGCSGLKELNVSNFNTSKVTDMSGMFSGCSGLTSLNVSNFNTSAVTHMTEMFSGCSGLKTILNPNTWRSEDSQSMFYGCTQLKGAVKYDERNVDVTMANPTTGYFTDPNRKLAYVLQSEDQHTLTFYYDNNRKLRSGKTWDIDEKSSSSMPVWAGTYESPNKAVTKVVFDASFKDFRPTTTSSWFSYFKALTTIVGLENLNTSAVKDMWGMFKDCSGLKELNVSNFNTSSVTDMGWMFSGCSGLKELNVSNFNISAVMDLGGMFSGCSGLKELNVSNFNTSAVTNMSWMFSGCSGLKELNVSNFNTSKVTNMGGIFNGCSSLTSLNLSNFNTSAVTNMSQMFTNCSGLKTILNPNTWRSDNSINMFYGCTQLKGAVKYDASKLDVTMANPTTGYFTDPNREYPKAYVLQNEDQHTLSFYYDNNRRLRSGKTWDIDEKSSSSIPAWAGTYESPNKAVTKVVFDASFKDFRPTTTSSWFSYFKALTTIVGLENFNTSAVTDMGWMFYGCSGLKELNVSNFNTSSVTNMSHIFSGCSGLKAILNPNTWRCEDSQSMFYGCTQLKGAVKYDASKLDVTMANPTTGYFTDPNREYPKAYVLQNEDQHTLTFYYDNNRKLRSGKTWDIDEKSSSSKPAWAGTVESPNNVVTKVVFNASFKDFRPTTTSSWFSYFKALTTIVGLENLNTSAVTDMGGMFYGCSGLKELNVSNFNTSSVTNMSHMFSGCSGLKELNVSNFNTSKVTDMHQMFEGCSGLKELNVSNFNTSKVTDMRYMFYYCSGLKELNVSNFNTSAVMDMGAMFYGCSGLKELNVSNFNTSAVTNMNQMFTNCSGLKTILNPNTWRCEDSQSMFYGCTQLKGAVKYDASKLDVTMANPTTGYFSQKLPSAIGRVAFDDNNGTQIYNLQGKRVNANQRHLPAGFYIVNGKKVYLNEKP